MLKLFIYPPGKLIYPPDKLTYPPGILKELGNIKSRHWDLYAN